MNPMNFKDWLKSKQEPVVDLWSRTSVDTSFIKEKGVNDFVDRMTNTTILGMMIGIIFNGRTVDNEIYKAKIGGNLISIRSKKLQEAKGVISSQSKPVFGFYMIGQNAGNMLIQFPPAIFDNEDKKVLKSIIIHESVHAYDWATDRINDDYPIGDILFNIDKYTRNLFEVRAFVAQLKVLMKEINDINLLINQLTNGPFAVKEELIPIIMQYLRKNLSEGIGKLVMPIATAASLMGQTDSHAPSTPTPITFKQESHSIQQAAKIIKNIINKMKFANFIQKRL